MLKTPFAPLEPYSVPVALQIARSHHDVTTRIERGAAVVSNHPARPIDVEAIGPEVLAVGVLQVHVHVAAR